MTDTMSTQQQSGSAGEMTLFEHLSELRMRLVRCALAITIGAIVVLAFYNTVLSWLLKPYADLCVARIEDNFCGANFDPSTSHGLLIITDPLEGLGTRMRIAGYGGIVLALPVLLWQLWRFVVPALHQRERRYAASFVGSTLALFALGGYIAFWTMGKTLEFLISWAGDDVAPAFRVQSYIRLITLMIVAFGVGFTLPVLLVFLEALNVLHHRTLLRYWRYAIVIILVVAAGITPSGDPISLLALSIPLTLFYFIAVFIGWLLQRGRDIEKDIDTARSNDSAGAT